MAEIETSWKKLDSIVDHIDSSDYCSLLDIINKQIRQRVRLLNSLIDSGTYTRRDDIDSKAKKIWAKIYREEFNYKYEKI